jgi:hypothetical protein
LEEPSGRPGDLIHGPVESLGVPPRRLTVAADLPHELQRGGPDFLFGGRPVGAAKGDDAPAHARTLPCDTLVW